MGRVYVLKGKPLDPTWETIEGHDKVSLARNTPAGMAGIMGTGPFPKTCRECAFWGGNCWQITIPGNAITGQPARKTRDLEATTKRQRWVAGHPQRQPCFRYRQLRRQQRMGEVDMSSRRVEHGTPACSHFQPAPTPQAVDKPPNQKKTAHSRAKGSEATESAV